MTRFIDVQLTPKLSAPPHSDLPILVPFGTLENLAFFGNNLIKMNNPTV